MPGLVRGIHVLWGAWRGVDGRDKPGHDVVEAFGSPLIRGWRASTPGDYRPGWLTFH
jgi:hypothetical protein